jgi:hypothetical protein
VPNLEETGWEDVRVEAQLPAFTGLAPVPHVGGLGSSGSVGTMAVPSPHDSIKTVRRVPMSAL